MGRKRIIDIPKGYECEDCGSTNLRGFGTYWKNNPQGDNLPRVKIQRLICNDCGKKQHNGIVK